MKRIIAIILVLAALVPAFASEEGPRFTYDLFARGLYVRKSIAAGGGLSLGVQDGFFRFEAYALADYYLSPLGGSGGAASLEFSAEAGGTFSWKLLSAGFTDTFIGLDVGYFAQFAKVPLQPERFFMGHNGIMIRPSLKTYLNFSRHYDMSIGVFFQMPLYPEYSEYRCIGVTLGIL